MKTDWKTKLALLKKRVAAAREEMCAFIEATFPKGTIIEATIGNSVIQPNG